MGARPRHPQVPEYAASAAITALLLLSGRWFVGLLHAGLLAYMAHLWVKGTVTVDSMDAFRQLPGQKQQRLVLLVANLTLFVIVMYRCVQGGRRGGGREDRALLGVVGSEGPELLAEGRAPSLRRLRPGHGKWAFDSTPPPCCRLVETAIHTLLTPEGRALTKVRGQPGASGGRGDRRWAQGAAACPPAATRHAAAHGYSYTAPALVPALQQLLHEAAASIHGY